MKTLAPFLLSIFVGCAAPSSSVSVDADGGLDSSEKATRVSTVQVRRANGRLTYTCGGKITGLAIRDDGTTVTAWGATVRGGQGEVSFSRGPGMVSVNVTTSAACTLRVSEGSR